MLLEQCDCFVHIAKATTLLLALHTHTCFEVKIGFYFYIAYLVTKARTLKAVAQALCIVLFVLKYALHKIEIAQIEIAGLVGLLAVENHLCVLLGLGIIRESLVMDDSSKPVTAVFGHQPLHLGSIGQGQCSIGGDTHNLLDVKTRIDAVGIGTCTATLAATTRDGCCYQHHK